MSFSDIFSAPEVLDFATGKIQLSPSFFDFQVFDKYENLEKVTPRYLSFQLHLLYYDLKEMCHQFWLIFGASACLGITFIPIYILGQFPKSSSTVFYPKGTFCWKL